MITGNTQLVGLIGWPVEHSLSPAMHNVAFDALRLNWRYVPLPVPPGQVETAVRGLAAMGFRGANVTLPHKRAVLAALDSIHPHARALGAVNTLVFERQDDGTTIISGHNTDSPGFARALRRGGFRPEDGRNAVVVGAGGAARAVVAALRQSGIGGVTVLNRTPERALTLVSDLRVGDTSVSRLRALPLTPDALIESTRLAGLLVNATTVGMWPDVDDSIWPQDVPLPSHLTVFDLVYNPVETQLLRQARRSGAAAIDGLGMLIWQGASSFELWTGEPAPVEVMRSVCEWAMKAAGPPAM
jgi:shikimate dehydrogenase